LSVYKDGDRPHRETTLLILILTSLAASALHFIDNAMRLDLYPGPSWFTPPGVIAAWFGLPALALIAWRLQSKPLLALFALTGFFGFDHYLVTPLCGVPLRCNATIFAEAIASGVLVMYIALQWNKPGFFTRAA
jgi:hypothetical protein